MAKFKIGDKVRVRPDANSQFRGRVGTVQKLPNEVTNVTGYMVKIDLQGFAPTCQISEKDLEPVSGQ